jgi:hypothetical protein
MQVKPKAKSKSKADQYDSKLLPKPGKQTPADFMPKSYDTRFKPVKGGGTGNEYLNLGPREKDPKGMSKNGSKLKKAQKGDEVKTVDRGELEEVTVTAKRTPTKSKMPSTTPSKSMNLSDKIKSVASSDNKKTGRLQAFKNDMKSSLRGLPKALRPVGAGPAAGVNAIGGQIGFKKRTEAQKRAGDLNRDSKKMGGKVAKKMAPKMMMKKISKKK